MEEHLKDIIIPEVAEAAVPPRRGVWTSQRAYIIASIAMVVGLGNLWRFPYMAGENGGGIFVVAYAICILTIGIALHALETSAGKLAQKGAVGVFTMVNPRWGPWFGRFLILLLVVMMSYYLVVSGWTLGYAWDAIRLDLKPFDVFTSGYASLWLMLATSVLTYLVLLKGIAGLERSSKILLPILVVFIGSLAIYAQTLPGAGEARQFYFSFDPKGLLDPGIWRMAAAQAFYSLGIGQGMLFAYGSYAPKHFNKVISSSAVAVTNSTVSIIAGLLVFPIVFTFGIAPDTGSQLSFVAFPRMLDGLAGGQVIGIVFYILLFVAAFTSCVGGMAAVLGSIRDQFNIGQYRAALMVTTITAVLAIPSALSFTSIGFSIDGKPFLDIIDQATGSGIVIIAGISGAALISWLVPARKVMGAINMPPTRVGRVTLSSAWIIYIGRFLPVVAATLILLAWLA